MSFGDFGDGNSGPRGRPYQVTGTLNGLPPCPGNIFLERNDQYFSGDHQIIRYSCTTYPFQKDDLLKS